MVAARIGAVSIFNISYAKTILDHATTVHPLGSACKVICLKRTFIAKGPGGGGSEARILLFAIFK